MRPIKTIAGLQRAWDAKNRRYARLYKRPYILGPALDQHLPRFGLLDSTADAGERYQLFLSIPSLESDMDAVDANFTADQRKSLAQQDRAKHPRTFLTTDRVTLRAVIFEMLRQFDDPWHLKAKQYWAPFISRLRHLGLSPVLATHPRAPMSEIVEYTSGDRRRSLTLRQFENIVSKVRRGLRDPN
jgi:hypothetical protein